MSLIELKFLVLTPELLMRFRDFRQSFDGSWKTILPRNFIPITCCWKKVISSFQTNPTISTLDHSENPDLSAIRKPNTKIDIQYCRFAKKLLKL